tara:strand:+ start:214 stop:552 length:339 start_codon:yes stop_codon:yes gene_type:complete
MGAARTSPKSIKNPDGTVTKQPGKRYPSIIHFMVDQHPMLKTLKGGADRSETKEEPVRKEEQNTFKSDYDDVRKRLLDKAKEERIQRQNQLTREKEVYGQSLPDSMQKNPYE